ncbi:MAG: DNA mismatch repair protein MutS, partial [Clostridium sp.]|nr:DNA mismatch repair protein MutS [Clostridium sp.]
LESAVTTEVKSTIVEIKEEVIIEPVIEEKVIEEIKTDNTPINIKENTEVLQMDFTMLEKEALLTKIADIEVMTMTPLDAMNMLFKIVQDAKKLK